MREVGVDVRRELKLIPAKVVVVEHATHVYACRPCEREEIKTTFTRAESPTALIPGSLASPSLVAHIATQKYSQGLPLYRLEKGFSYDGVNISRQTMANWIIKCCELYLEPVYKLLISFLLTQKFLHADETTVQVLREDGRTPQSKSYEWVYRSSGCAEKKIVIYEYKETRKQEHPKKFLANFKGFLHTDGYEVYHNLPPEIIVVGCWAHVRRKFETILKNAKKNKHDAPNAERGVAYCNALFKLEREFAELSPEERFNARNEKSKPIADEFFDWCAGLEVLPKVPLGEAVRYALGQRQYLENVWLDGRCEISNNRCERSVKPFVMGRKAWLFANTPAGAKASSVMYSIIETAKENGLHPARYIEFLLETLPSILHPGSDNESVGLEPYLPWSDTLPDYCRAPMRDNTVATTI
jgi:transposase